MLILAASLFFAHPTPLDMPRAEAYLVKEGGLRRLEDRFNRLDLWTSRTVTGRWADDDGRVFTLAVLSAMPPSVAGDATVTRVGYEAETAASGSATVLFDEDGPYLAFYLKGKWAKFRR